MLKKISAILLAGVALCVIASCDSPHEMCNWGDANYCDGDYAMTCNPSSRTWDEKFCEFGCVEYGAGAYCLQGTTPQLPTDGCGDVPAKGACFGDIAARCDTKTNTLITRDCAAKSLTCGFSNDHYDCVKSSSPTSPSKKYKEGDACGKVTGDGLCDGDSLVYCDGGTIHIDSCGKCAVDRNGRADCVSKYVDGDACGDITDDGICDGSMLVYCDASRNSLRVESCGKGCIVDDASRASCKVPCPDGSKVGERACLDDLSGYQYCDADRGLVTVICEPFREMPRTCTMGTDGLLGCHH